VTGPFDSAYYEDIRGRMRGILIAVSEAFPVQQVGLIDELIDANESGVALEMLVGMLVGGSVPVASGVVDQIERLVEEMHLSAEVAEQIRALEAT